MTRAHLTSTTGVVSLDRPPVWGSEGLAMCVAEPGLVVAVTDGSALVAIRGVVRQVPLTVLVAMGVTVSPGDFVLVHTGLAVATLTPEEAEDRSSFLQQGADHEDS